jgi:uncharacterized surface protein with fasciclin (FAS1) repeats
MYRDTRLAAAAALAVAAVALLAAVGCGSGSVASSPTPTATPKPSLTPKVLPSVSSGTILEAARAGNLNTFVAAIALAGLQSTLDQKIPFTVFVPNDEAFKSVGFEQLKQNLPKLKSIMAYHIVPTENLKLAAIKNGQKALTYDGSAVRFTVNGGAVMVNDANVVQVIEGPGWSIFVVDKVLVPPGASAFDASPSPSP